MGPRPRQRGSSGLGNRSPRSCLPSPSRYRLGDRCQDRWRQLGPKRYHPSRRQPGPDRQNRLPPAGDWELEAGQCGRTRLSPPDFCHTGSTSRLVFPLRLRRNGAVDHNAFGANILAVQVSIGPIIRTQGGTFQGRAGEQAAGPRIAQNRGPHEYVKICLHVPTYGARRRRCVTTDLHLPAENRTSASRVHHQQHKVRRLAPSLEPEANSFKSHHRWWSPGTLEILATPAAHCATAITSSNAESPLNDGRDYNHTKCPLQKTLRYA